MRRLAGVIVVVVVAGCGHSDVATLPVQCIEGSDGVLKALRSAPGAVVMGGTPISGCFDRNASGEQIQIVGSNLLAATQQLGDKARAGDGRAALEVGYLVGAAERGSSHNNDIGSEIVRRIEAETAGLGARRAAFERGRRAGLAQG